MFAAYLNDKIFCHYTFQGDILQEISELHRAARRYAEAGIPVFPVEVNGKKPVTANGFYDATTDLEQIDVWWGKAEYNLAFSPASVGLCVIDLDRPDIPESLPQTYTVKTPRGFHAYYEGSLPPTASRLGDNIDTRGEGSYVLVPPSSVGGLSYKVENILPYAPLPDWISTFLNKPEQKLTATVNELDLEINISRVKDLLTKYVEQGNVAIEGQGGDDLTYRICCEVLDFGLAPHTAFALLDDVWNSACRPPWGQEELAAKVQNAASYQQNEAGCKALEPTEKVFGPTVAKLFPVKRSRFYFKDENEQDNEPEPAWIIKDVISERSTVLLYGPTQSYKSFLALEIALCGSVGLDTFGSAVIPGPVFYAALEGRAHLKKARRAWKIANGIRGRLDRFYLGRAPLIGVPGECEEFMDEVAKRHPAPKLLIIDTLTKSMAGLNENDAKDAGQFIQFCDSLVERFGCSVLAVHHTGKDTARGARGSSAFHAGFDTVIEVSANRSNKAVSVSVRKHKDAEERETPWTFEGRLIGGSLVFFPTTVAEHRALTNEESEYSSRKIGAALQKLGAYGEDHGVTTNVLVSSLRPQTENEVDADYQLAIGRMMRSLHRMAKDQLDPYVFRVGKGLLWALPAPH